VLAGTLNDVSLPDVLSLLSQAKKTGSVHVTGDGRRGRIDLIAGNIGMAQAHVGKLGLVRRLVAQGFLEAGKLGPGLSAAAATPDPDIQLIRSVYRSGAVTADQVKAVVEAHIIDAMFDLGRVEAGRFRFDPCRVADLGVQRRPEDVYADVAARAELWAKIRASIPAPGAVVRMLPHIEQDELTITRATWRVLATIDGQRTVADLVDLLGDGEFEVSHALHRLVEAGLIEVVVNIGDSESDRVGVDHVLSLELELATLRSDPGSSLAGHLDWDTSSPDPTFETPTTSTGVVETDVMGELPAEAQDADEDQDTTPAEVPPGEPAVADVDTGVEAEQANAEPGINDEPEVFDTGMEYAAPGDDEDEPEVYTTIVDDADEDDEDDDESASARAPARRRTKSTRKVSLATSSDGHGRLLPEPVPGHDAADLTRRLLEGVGKS